MAFTTSVNNVHTPQRTLYELKEKLKTAGWTVLSSGDGTGGALSLVGDVLTTWSDGIADAVPGAITNQRAWYRIQAPDGRELLYQHAAFNTATDYCSMAYSRAAGFVGADDGAVAADVAPTADDSFVVMGERRPSVNLNGDSISGGSTITRVDYFIGDVSEGYAFAVYMRDAAGNIVGGFFYDCLENTISGDDPYVLFSPGALSTPFQVNGRLWSTYSAGWSFKDPGVGSIGTIAQSNFGPWGTPASGAPRIDAAQRHGIIRPCYWQGYNVLNPGGANPYNSRVDILEPAYWYATSILPTTGNPPWAPTVGPSNIGTIKGSSRFIKGISSAAGFSNRDTNTTLTRIAQAGGYWLLWDGATTPLA